MFWDKNYTPHNIEALLEKEDVTVEEFLDEDDIIQECKTQKKNLLKYFTRPDVIRRLVELIITEPSEDLHMSLRFRHANVACEILTLGLPSLDEKLLEDNEALKLLYSYLENEPPLNPLLASFFSKTFRTLFTKKSDQDWFLYQEMCLKLMQYLKLQNNFLDLVCKHFATPVIPDLIMQMVDNVEGGQLKRSLYEWFNEEKLIEKLIAIIGDSNKSDKHNNVSEFFCDLIQHGRTMRQRENENDSFEAAFEGSNPVLKTIESRTTLEALFNVILQPNATESTIVPAITVVLKIIKPTNIIDERNSDRLKFLQDREKDIHEHLLSNVISVVEPHLKRFNYLLENPPKKPDIVITTAKLSPPFGITRLQICRLFTVLLQTNNDAVSKAICETDFFNILLKLFEQYCWNNFLHIEVEKCLQCVFNRTSGNTSNISTHVGNTPPPNAYKTSNAELLDSNAINIFNSMTAALGNGPMGDGLANTPNKLMNAIAKEGEEHNNKNAELSLDINTTTMMEVEPIEDVQGTGDQITEQDLVAKNIGNKTDDHNNTSANEYMGASYLQYHAIVNCKVVSKLLHCWQYNREMENGERGRRLGYMGHLIKIFNGILSCISEFEHIGALIENNLNEDEMKQWQEIVCNEDGELINLLTTQNKQLANCNPHQFCDYHTSFDFLTDNVIMDSIVGSATDTTDVAFEDDDDNEEENIGQKLQKVKNSLNLFQLDDDEDEDDYDEEESGMYNKIQLTPQYSVQSRTWQANDSLKLPYSMANWTNSIESDNFADFDSHFSSFSNDLGESFSLPYHNVASDLKIANSIISVGSSKANLNPENDFNPNDKDLQNSEEYDNNANVEKSAWVADFSNFQVQKATQQHNVNTKSYIDDYDDDEGMWIKPLGAVSAAMDVTKISSAEYLTSKESHVVNNLDLPKGHDHQQQPPDATNEKLTSSFETLTTENEYGLNQDNDSDSYNLDIKPSKLNIIDSDEDLSNNIKATQSVTNIHEAAT